MSNHRVQPCAEVRVRRAWREFLRGIHEATTLTRDDFILMPPPLEAQPTILWSPDTPTMPAGHVWTLPGVGTSKLDRALWWSEPGNLRDNVHLIHLALGRPLTIQPGGHGYQLSVPDQSPARAHEEDA